MGGRMCLPLAVGTIAPRTLLDPVVRWGPVSVLTARPRRAPAIIVEHRFGVTPATFRRSEPRC